VDSALERAFPLHVMAQRRMTKVCGRGVQVAVAEWLDRARNPELH
jgi:hypothetical protein